MERATESAERTLSRHQSLPGWHLVTEASHPLLFNVFETISHDAGYGAGHTNYSVPDTYNPRKLALHEAQLSRMTKEQQESFAIGGDDDEDIEKLRVEFGDLHAFLNHFFEDWDEG